MTYPIDSNPANLPAALAWEAAFLQLAQGELRGMAAAANLSLAFQAERCGIGTYLAEFAACLMLRVG